MMRNKYLVLGLICAGHFGCGIDDADRCTDAPYNSNPSLRRAPGFVLKATIKLPRGQDSLRRLDIADLDANGRPDLVVSGAQKVWLQSIGESLDFEKATILPGLYSYGTWGLVLGDANSDGRDEVVGWQNDQVFVVNVASQARPEQPLWVSPWGEVIGVNIDEEAQEMIVSSYNRHTVLDISTSEPIWVEDIAVPQPSAPVRLLNVDGRTPMDLISPINGGGSVVTLRDGREANSVPMLEVVREAAVIRTPWSDRTLVTLPEWSSEDGHLWLRKLRADGSSPASVWAWGSEDISSFSVVDADADGYDELILHYSDAAVLVQILEDGSVKVIGRIGAKNPRQSWEEGGAIAADLDNDGRAEIVLIGPDDTLEIFSGPTALSSAATCIMPRLPDYLGTVLSWN